MADRKGLPSDRPALRVVSDAGPNPDRSQESDRLLIAVAVVDAKFRVPLRDAADLEWGGETVAVEHLEGRRVRLSRSTTSRSSATIDERTRLLLGRGTCHWLEVQPGQRIAAITDPVLSVIHLVSATALAAALLDGVPA